MRLSVLRLLLKFCMVEGNMLAPCVWEAWFDMVLWKAVYEVLNEALLLLLMIEVIFSSRILFSLSISVNRSRP